jgi:hypothetical protein
MLIVGKVGGFISNECAADRSLYEDVSDPIFGKVTLRAVIKTPVRAV